MTTSPTEEQIFDGVYTVLNSLEALHTLGAGANAASSSTPSDQFGQLAGVLATQLADCCSNLADYLEVKEKMP